MTDPQRAADMLPTGGVAPGGLALREEPAVGSADTALAHESGVEVKARSQWSYVRMRFLRHRLAVVSLIVLILIALVGVFAPQLAPYGYDDIDLENTTQPPTLEGWHLFGTDLLGRDYLSRVMFGIRTSLWVAVFVAFLATAVGTAIGAVAGYYSGHVDNLLMRFTDLILTLPGLAVLLTASVFFGSGDPLRIGVILALLFWTFVARIVRGLFLSLREKEFVEAAKAAGAGDARIIMRHILPNCVGQIVVFMTLIVATAILTEAALSFLGFGIQPPNAALGKLIADGEGEGFDVWWLVTFPGLVIVVIALCINFVGDGLRDALDPTQRRTRA
ncbi:MAG TPA: ABC transporter permease [Gaiellaceae bacterium]|jgi:ABC-type dipeptide/oligopeptide/nickel transport system permease subunit|nr:ABC transporter permease [Gaiellaceae bacterium]